MWTDESKTFSNFSTYHTIEETFFNAILNFNLYHLKYKIHYLSSVVQVNLVVAIKAYFAFYSHKYKKLHFNIHLLELLCISMICGNCERMKKPTDKTLFVAMDIN